MSDLLTLHWSDLQRYRACPARFRFEHPRGLNLGRTLRRRQVKAKMLYGSLWHAKFSSYHTGEPVALAFERSAAELGPEGRALASDLWAEIEPDFAWYLEASKSVRLIEQRWIERGAGSSLVLPVSPSLAIAGTPDLIARIEADWGGGLILIDHKTHGVLTETASGPRYEPAPRELTLNGYFHSRQFAFYCGLWNRLYPSEPIDTAVLNLVPQRVMHVLRFLESRRGKPKLPEVTREIIPYATDYCDRLVREAIQTAQEIEHLFDSSAPEEHWPQHDQSCFHFGEVCPFLDVCESGDLMRATLLEALGEEAS